MGSSTWRSCGRIGPVPSTTARADLRRLGMPTATPRPTGAADTERPPRWRAALLAGEPCEYTNDELIAEINAAFAAPVLTPRRLRNWTELGLVPKPARRVPPAAADGVPRALYPWWT